MRFLDALVPRRELTRYQPPPWLLNSYLSPGGFYQPGYTTTYGTDKAEPIGDSFADYVSGGLSGNSIVWTVEQVRLALFSEIRFQFQYLKKGRPGDLWGNESLSILEEPWIGGTTSDLCARMILDADFAGNYFATEMDGEVVRLRPDWVEIVLAERYDRLGNQIGWRKIGYLYYEGGKQSGNDPSPLLPEDVVHFAPNPDPLATWRGMSWLTPVVREVMADGMATKHKLKFFENSATPNLAVSLPKEISPDDFNRFVDTMEAKYGGVDNAYRTLYTGGGADVTVVGSNLAQLDFKVTQGAGETRIAGAAGVHPAIAGLSEGLQGSTLNEGNFAAARRLFADKTLRHLWRNAAGSLQVLVPPPSGSRLWYDERDVAFLREDAKDAAEIVRLQAVTIAELVREGFTDESAKAAVISGNMSLLKHTGFVSVQLQPPGTTAGPGPVNLVPDEAKDNSAGPAGSAAAQHAAQIAGRKPRKGGPRDGDGDGLVNEPR